MLKGPVWTKWPVTSGKFVGCRMNLAEDVSVKHHGYALFFTIYFSVSQGYRIQTLSWSRVWYCISFIFLTWFVVNTVFLSHMCNSWLSFPRLIRSERKNNKQYIWFSAARSGFLFYVMQIPDAAVLEAARTNCGVVQYNTIQYNKSLLWKYT